MTTVKVIRSADQFSDRPIPDHFAAGFKSNLSAVGEANGLTAERVYSMWHKYSSDCSAGDQSAIWSEFLSWYRDQLPVLPAGMNRLG